MVTPSRPGWTRQTGDAFSNPTPEPLCGLFALCVNTKCAGIDLLKKCVDEVQSRLVVAPAAFHFTAIDKDGVRKIALYPEISQ